MYNKKCTPSHTLSELTNKFNSLIGLQGSTSTMIYEFIATLSAGFLLAGVALIIRHLAKLVFKKQTPKWLTPLFAAIGIFGFQIHQEYNWYPHMTSQLSEDTTVVKAIEQSYWYRPWTYIKPQVARFMAMSNPQKQNTSTAAIYSYQLYLFERRMSTKAIGQNMDCTNARVMDIQIQDGMDTPALTIKDPRWVTIEKDNEIYKKVCL